MNQTSHRQYDAMRCFSSSYFCHCPVSLDLCVPVWASAGACPKHIARAKAVARRFALQGRSNGPLVRRSHEHNRRPRLTSKRGRSRSEHSITVHR